MWSAGESYFVCKLVLEELDIIQGFWGRDWSKRVSLTGYVWGMDMTVKRIFVAGLQGRLSRDSRIIPRVDLYPIMGEL